jgi:nucleoside triphosphate pyrophosphatase
VLESHGMLVLASNSPRRKQLLGLGGWSFTVSPAAIDETPFDAEAPADYVARLAEGKVRKAARQAPAEALILAADTTVAVPAHTLDDSADQILGKPGDAQEAEKMLRLLRGRSHRVYTGLAVLRVSDGSILQDVCMSEVMMRDYSDDEMLAYIASGDPLDKAGAYAVQHAGFHPVERLAGCVANVMGLPVCHLARLLAEFNLPPRDELPGECQQMLGYDCPIYRQVLEGSVS